MRRAISALPCSRGSVKPFERASWQMVQEASSQADEVHEAVVDAGGQPKCWRQVEAPMQRTERLVNTGHQSIAGQ